MNNRATLITIFVFWCIIGLFNIYNWAFDTPCTWINYFTCWLFTLIMNFNMIRLVRGEDLD